MSENFIDQILFGCWELMKCTIFVLSTQIGPFTASALSKQTAFLNNQAAAYVANYRNGFYLIFLFYSFCLIVLIQASQEQHRDSHAKPHQTQLSWPWKSSFWKKRKKKKVPKASLSVQRLRQNRNLQPYMLPNLWRQNTRTFSAIWDCCFLKNKATVSHRSALARNTFYTSRPS